VRRGSIVQLIVIGVLAGGVASAVALIPSWLPEPASREAGRIHFVFWFVTGICIFIFAIVAAVSIYTVWKFRVKPDDDSDGHRSTATQAWRSRGRPYRRCSSRRSRSSARSCSPRTTLRGADPLRVDVVAQQFFWSYRYPEFDNKESDILRLPVNRSVVLRMTSKDVIHSFWVPEFGQKQDVVPGIHPTLHITPDRVGTYPVICTELCGLGHALMRSRTIVMTGAAFQKWANQKGGA
jgi:cytochrome c oxidase subunit 2